MFGWLFGKSKGNEEGLLCAACDSADLTVMAPQAYRCNACGHEGGDGWAAWQDMQTRARYDDWSIAQLREHAQAQLSEARSILAAAHGQQVPIPITLKPDGSLGIGMWSKDQTATDIERARQIAQDIDLSLHNACTKVHAATLTIDALIDKGDTHLADIQPLLANMGERPAVGDADALLANRMHVVAQAFRVLTGE